MKSKGRTKRPGLTHVNLPRKFLGDPAMGIRDDVIEKPKPPRKKMRRNPFPMPPDRA